MSSAKAEQSLKYNADNFVQLINRFQLLNDATYKLSTNIVDDNCLSLMDTNMVTGQLGREVEKLFIDNTKTKDPKDNRFPLLTAGGSVAKTCPKYPKMSPEEKAQVWVLILTSIAHFESQCKAKAHAKGPNGTAFGYYQLHKGKEPMYDDYAGFCVKNASQSPKAASLCTFGMLERQFRKNNGELFSKESYWDVLRPNGAAQKAGKIRLALRKSKLCSDQVL